MNLSVFLAPVRETPDHIALAESLGFTRAWCYDSPLLYHDPFVTLARAADRTTRIGLGIGVVVPRLRTPVATTAGLRSLSALAPGRVAAAVGAGFTEVVLPQDQAVVTADNIRRFGFCGTAADLARRVAEMERDGVTELAIQPGGDIPSELRRIAEALL